MVATTAPCMEIAREDFGNAREQDCSAVCGNGKRLWQEISQKSKLGWLRLVGSLKL